MGAVSSLSIASIALVAFHVPARRTKSAGDNFRVPRIHPYPPLCACGAIEFSFGEIVERDWRWWKNVPPAGVSGVSGELGYEFAVGRQEIQLAQGFRRAPFHGLEGLVADVTGCRRCFEENQIDGFTHLGVLMARAIYFRTDSRDDSELFLQLSRQGFRRGLAGLQLSTGEFPHQPERIGSAPLADQQLSVRFD